MITFLFVVVVVVCDHPSQIRAYLSAYVLPHSANDDDDDDEVMLNVLRCQLTY